jgi:hypothetical protein
MTNLKSATILFFAGTYETKWDRNFPTTSQGDYIWATSAPNYLDTVGKYYTNAIKNELTDLNQHVIVEYEDYTSPREYNFSTDRIFIKIDVSTISKLVEFAMENKENFKAYLAVKYTSCWGFHSYYSTDLDDWEDLKIDDMDHNHVGSFLEFYLRNEIQTYDNDIDWYFYETIVTDVSEQTIVEYDYPHVYQFADNLFNDCDFLSITIDGNKMERCDIDHTEDLYHVLSERDSDTVLIEIDAPKFT